MRSLTSLLTFAVIPFYFFCPPGCRPTSLLLFLSPGGGITDMYLDQQHSLWRGVARGYSASLMLSDARLTHFMDSDRANAATTAPLLKLRRVVWRGAE